MTSFARRWNSPPRHTRQGDLARRLGDRSIKVLIKTRFRQVMLQLLVTTVLAALSAPARSQLLAISGDSSGMVATTTYKKLNLNYERPTEKTMIRNYGFDAFGPYPIAGSAIIAGINQESNAPPEWNQGLKGYGRRFGSDFGIEAVGTTTRYALAEAFREDTLYYRCECSGFLPRLRHAALSTLTARRGDDGHRVFSFPALVAPYAGSMTAVYSWYPDRYGAKDAFRMGNYSLLLYAGGNISLEFLYSGPHSLFSQMHLNNTHGAQNSGPNH